MASQNSSTIFVVGASGAQGFPVVRDLVSDGKYAVRALTRDASSERAKALLSLGDVSLVEGSFASDAVLRAGMRGCDGAFVNIDGFNTGEKTEMYWAIRSYEIALEEGVTFFVFGNLDYALKKSGYDSAFRTGHYDGKGRIAELILGQTQSNNARMGAAVFTSGPYIEMAVTPFTPMTPTVEDGVVTWRVPLGQGAIPHVSLEDCGYYVRWLFEHPRLACGLNLEVAIEDVAYTDLAAAFTAVTGRPARYIDTSLDDYWKGSVSGVAHSPAGYNADPGDPATMTFRDNFTGFWNLWKNRIITRNYALLDEIHPQRIRTVEQWLKREEQSGRDRGQGGLWDRVQPANWTQNDILLESSADKRTGAL